MKKIRISKELTYISALLLISFSVAMISTTGFGVSMIVGAAYIVSLKFDFLTFGQAEYIVQGLWFVAFCIAMRKFKFQYFFAFVTSLIYGLVLDMWRMIIPHFNPDITAIGSLPLYLRIIYFVFGMVLTSLAVAMFFKTYLYPQVYDFFVKFVSQRYNIKQSTFKICYDMFSLLLCVILTLSLFKGFQGVGIGTLIMACLNGFIIGFFSKFLDNHCEFYSWFPKAEKFFEI